jgi:hypothetical protein
VCGELQGNENHCHHLSITEPIMKILIEIRGGIVQRIITSESCQVVIIDYDNIETADNADQEIEEQVLPREPDTISNPIHAAMHSESTDYIDKNVVKKLIRNGF